MTIQKLFLVGTLALASLAGCAPMDTRHEPYYDHVGEHQQYDRNDYRYGQDYRPGANYQDDRAYQQGPAYIHADGQPGYYRDGGRMDPACQACGVVRSITQVAGGSGGNNTGAIVVGAVVGGALGNTVGRGDGRRAATVVGAVAGGAVANEMTRDNARHDLYRIDVHMNNGEMYSFDQHDHQGLYEGSPVEVRDGHVYPLN
jgi:outer membrane lipoprotein SlyB